MRCFIRGTIAFLSVVILLVFGLSTIVYAKDVKANKTDIAPVQEKISQVIDKSNYNKGTNKLDDKDKSKKQDKKEEHHILAITNTSPVNGSINISINTSIKITFNKPISRVWNNDKKSNNKDITLRSNNGREVAIACSVDNDTLIITPKETLKNGIKYELIIPENAVQGKDKAKLHQDFRLVFTTKAAESTIVSINEITQIVNEGDNYSLPKTVIANMSDGIFREVPLNWSPSTANTSKAGTYTFQGTVNGYNGTVTLRLIVASSDVIKPKYVDKTFKLYKDSSKVWAELEFDQALPKLIYEDFYIKGDEVASVIVPDSGYPSGRKVILNFNGNNKKELIMALGPDAKLFTVQQAASANSSGITIAPIDGVQVWDDQIAPEWTTIADNSYVVVTTNVASYGVTGIANNAACVVLKFTEALDDSIAGLYKDDFIFMQEGKPLTVDNIIVKGQYLIYTFKQGYGPIVDVTKRLNVKANSIVDIRDKKDSGAKDYNKYVPKSDDLAGRYWGN